ncbi:hypothetical protein, partial [Bacillus cereus]|uniref:hypothetical protein n=1 Tax=Bacillus cereus TaxID=1396 RepID=UPI00211D6E90
MSLPNIPNITPVITVTSEEAKNLLLSSIAMEEIGLSHILNAEGEKIQCFLKTKDVDLNSALLLNKSVNNTLKTVLKSQLLLQLKLEDVISMGDDLTNSPPKKCTCSNCHGQVSLKKCTCSNCHGKVGLKKCTCSNCHG